MKRCLEYLWVCYLAHNRHTSRVTDEKIDKGNARLSFSPKHCRAVAKNSLEPLVFMYHEAMSLFLRHKNALNLVNF